MAIKLFNIEQSKTNFQTSKLYVFAKLTTYKDAIVAYFLLTKSDCPSKVYDVWYSVETGSFRTPLM